MNRIIILFLVAATTFILFNIFDDSEYTEIENEAENSFERAKWEFNRLRDPKTNTIPTGIKAAETEFSKSIAKDKNLVAQKSSKVNLKNEWVHRGPSNQGGRTRAFAVDINNEDIMLAGGASGGMWRSSDGGESWTKVTEPDVIQSVTCITQDTRPGKTNIWYYGTGEYRSTIAIGNQLGGSTPPLFEGNGIFKSTDNGLTWFQLESTKNTDFDKYNRFDFIWSIVVDPSNEEQDEVYAAAIGGIYKSVDGGETWSEALVPTDYGDYSTINDVDISDSGVLYACISNQTINNKSYENRCPQLIYRSEDGNNWSYINSDFVPTSLNKNYSRMVLDISPSDPNTVYFYSSVVNFHEGRIGEINRIMKYDHESGTWNYTDPISTSLLSTQRTYNMVIAVNPTDKNLVYAGGVNLQRIEINQQEINESKFELIGGTLPPEDGGIGWSHTHHPDQHSFRFSYSDPRVVYSGNDGGVYKTNDILAPTVKWESLNNGYITSQFYTVAIDKDTPQDPTIVGGLQDNGKRLTTDYGEAQNWDYLRFFGDGAFGAVDNSTSSIYFSNQNAFAFRRWIENGDTLYSVIRPDFVGNYLFIHPYILNPTNKTQVFFPKTDVIMRNDDITQLEPFDPENLLTARPQPEYWTEMTNTNSESQISAISMTTIPASRLYYGTADGSIYRVDNADTGDPLPADITGSNMPEAYVGCLAVNPQNGDEVIAVFTNYNVQSLFRTTDGGESWSPIGGTLEEFADGSGNGPSCRWVSIMPMDNTTYYYVATSTGLYAADEVQGMETNWIQQGSETIGNVVVESVATRSSDGTVVIGTHGNGVYSTQLNVTSVDNDQLQNRFELSQNYPNPFNPTTTISYSIPKQSNVSLKVFDIVGREVAVLVDKEKSAGSHKIDFNASELSSGVYIYRLQSDDFSETKKMMLLK